MHWLQVGDSNHHYFYTSMKERYCRNKIQMLYDSGGNQVTEEDTVRFYKQLLGSCADSLPSIEPPIIRDDSSLSLQAKALLCVSVSTDETDAAINDIDSSKSPGLDGFNALFFK